MTEADRIGIYLWSYHPEVFTLWEKSAHRILTFHAKSMRELRPPDRRLFNLLGGTAGSDETPPEVLAVFNRSWDRRAAGGDSTKLAFEGLEEFRKITAARAAKDHAEAFTVTRCPSCNWVCASPWAEQCFECGRTWRGDGIPRPENPYAAAPLWPAAIEYTNQPFPGDRNEGEHWNEAKGVATLRQVLTDLESGVLVPERHEWIRARYPDDALADPLDVELTWWQVTWRESEDPAVWLVSHNLCFAQAGITELVLNARLAERGGPTYEVVDSLVDALR